MKIMVKHVKNKRLFGIVTTIMIVLFGASLGLLWMVQRDVTTQDVYLHDARKVSVQSAINQCSVERDERVDCSTMTADGSYGECEGRPCWIMYARDEKSLYGLSVTTALDPKGNMVVVDSLEDSENDSGAN